MALPSKQLVGYFPGAFDLVHAGHVLAIEEAKSKCDYLIIGLGECPEKGNPHKNSPVMSLEERYTMLRANKFVDAIIVYRSENDSKALDAWLPYDIRFMGDDHSGTTHPHIDKPIIYLSREHNYSSSNLRKRVHQAECQKY